MKNRVTPAQLHEQASAALQGANQLLQQASELLKKGDLAGANKLQDAAQDKQKEFSRLMDEAHKQG